VVISSTQISLIVSSSLGWAVVDACKKVLAGRMNALPVVILLSFGQMLLFAGWATYEGKYLITKAYLYPAICSVFLNILANVLFMRSVTLSPFSATVPLLALSPVFTTIAAFFLLSEWPSILQMTGMLVVVLGALILNIQFTGFSSLWSGFIREKGSLYMVAVAILFSVASSFDKAAVKHLSGSSHGVVLSGGVALGLFTLLAIKGQIQELKEAKGNFKTLLMGVLFSGIALGFQLLACQTMLMSLFESMKTVAFVFITLILGRLIFKEKINKRKILAAALISIGTVFICRS
jgi:drug/metabolite transporter (DMT)-like permease